MSAVRMETLDRVMRAYEQKRKLTEEQARFIRAEVSKFIDELLGSKQLPPYWPKRAGRDERDAVEKF